MESPWKTRITIAAVALAIGLPLYFISDPGLNKILKKAWDEKSTPDAPKTIWKVIRTYDITFRPEKADPIAEEWLKNFGGDWNRIQMGEQFGYEPWAVNPAAENALPKPVSERPHPLTADVLIRLGKRAEVGRDYVRAKWYFNVVLAFFKDNAEAVKQANDGLMRDKVRSF